jgi:hypothetical protein
MTDGDTEADDAPQYRSILPKDHNQKTISSIWRAPKRIPENTILRATCLSDVSVAIGGASRSSRRFVST